MHSGFQACGHAVPSRQPYGISNVTDPALPQPLTSGAAIAQRLTVTMAASSLPKILSPALLSYLQGHPQLPSSTWYFITGVTLSVINRPDEIPTVFSYALEKGGEGAPTKPSHDEQLQIARRMREALVKTAPIGGLPKVQLFGSENGTHFNTVWSRPSTHCCLSKT